MPAPSRLVSGPLQTERQSDGKRRLLRDLVVDVDGERFTVPAGTITDFSSIPWYGRMLVHWSKVDIAGIVHDWLYATGRTSRSQADRVWRLIAIAGEHHANPFQAWTAWLALRVGGWWAWFNARRRDRSADDSDARQE